jgi:hypothetical protein
MQSSRLAESEFDVIAARGAFHSPIGQAPRSRLGDCAARSSGDGL